MNTVKNSNFWQMTEEKNRFHGPCGLKNSHISLKQWKLLQTVGAAASFSEAANMLHVSQPAITYSISKLEDQLGVTLFKPGGRKLRLTAEAEALIEQSKKLIQEAIILEEFTNELKKCNKKTLRMVADQEFPCSILMHAVRQFGLYEPCAKIRLIESSASKVKAALVNRSTDLAITDHVPTGFIGELLFQIEYIAVAHPNHPLSKLCRPITEIDILPAVEITLNSIIELPLNAETSNTAWKRWQVSTFDTLIKALNMEIGYAWISRHHVQHLIDQKLLSVLDLPGPRTAGPSFYLVYGEQQTSFKAEIEKLSHELRQAAENQERGV